jgi:site-specific DNA-methyltransferase (cytosine-N4-specific)
VLDPFGGTGTTALVAAMNGRTGISADLSADYCRLAAWRAGDPRERARAAGLSPDQMARVAVSVPEQGSLFGEAS